MGIRAYDGQGETFQGWRGPGFALAAAIALAAFALLWANGRPIPEGPAAGPALAGKAVSALLAALTAAVLFAAAGRRYPTNEAAGAALVFAFGTSVWAASQSWSSALAAGLAVALAVHCLVRAEDEEAWADRAGFFLPLAAAFDPPAVTLAVVVLGSTFVRWPRRVLWLAAHVAGGLVVALLVRAVLPGGALSADVGSLAVPGPGTSPLAFFLSPARGVLVFSPVALVAVVGILRALRREPRFLPVTLLTGFLAQAGLLALTGDVETGRTWGTLLLTSAWPALLFFVPEGLSGLRLAGFLLALVAVAVQALGAFTYDQRWDRLHRTASDRIPNAALWDPVQSPIALALRERVVRLAAPAFRAGRWVVNTHPLVPGSPRGSSVEFGSAGPVVTGAEAAFGDVFLEGGACIEGTRLRLAAPGDGIFLRVTDSARARRLELRVVGRGRGTIVIGERTFWTEPRWTVHPVDGEFRLRKPYSYPQSGGPDLRIALSAAGAIDLQRVALVPPGEPENLIRLP